MRPNLAQRLEGLAIFAAAIVLYAHNGCSWWLYTVVAIAPDLTFAGYLLGPRRGATIYNLAHLYVWPAIIGAIGVLHGSPTHVAVALAWASHIGADRAFGFGLKYADAFKHTHLSGPVTN